MDPYSSPDVIPNNSLHNPFPPFPTKHQTDKLGAVYRTPWACSKARACSGISAIELGIWSDLYVSDMAVIFGLWFRAHESVKNK